MRYCSSESCISFIGISVESLNIENVGRSKCVLNCWKLCLTFPNFITFKTNHIFITAKILSNLNADLCIMKNLTILKIKAIKLSV